MSIGKAIYFTINFISNNYMGKELTSKTNFQL